jgi:hypothetical protein
MDAAGHDAADALETHSLICELRLNASSHAPGTVLVPPPEPPEPPEPLEPPEPPEPPEPQALS